MLGIDACPLEGIDPAFYNEALGLPAKGFSAKVAVALGYRAEDDALASLEKVRLPAESVFTCR
jgi:nitroreductase